MVLHISERATVFNGAHVSSNGHCIQVLAMNLCMKCIVEKTLPLVSNSHRQHTVGGSHSLYTGLIVIPGQSLSIPGQSLSIVGQSLSILGQSLSIPGQSLSIPGQSLSIVGQPYQYLASPYQ